MQNKATKMVEAMQAVVVAAQRPPYPDDCGVPYVGRLSMADLGRLAQAALEAVQVKRRCVVAGCENDACSGDDRELCEPCRDFLRGVGGESSAAAGLASRRAASEMERDLLQTLLSHVLRRPDSR